MSLLLSRSAPAETVQVAVAANFAHTLEKIGALFTARTGHDLRVNSASTGQLFAQIGAGAPFDVFFAADTTRPAKLIAIGLAVPGSQYTYARGQLALWSPKPKAVDAEGHILRHIQQGIIALADPRTAPYGAEAKALLLRRGLWMALHAKGRLAIGSSVTQAYQFATTGAAQYSFVALSQIRANQHLANHGSYWVVPNTASLDQEVVLLEHGRNNPAATALLQFLRTEHDAHTLIVQHGYIVPTVL